MSGSQWEGGGSHRGDRRWKRRKKKKKNSHKGINVTRDSSLMARKRSTCPWTCAWYDERVPPSLSLSFLDPFRDRSSCRPASTGKPIFGAGRSTSLTDECQANIDSPRGNWGTRCTREPLCNVRRDQRGRRWPDYALVRLFAPPLALVSVFLHINARQCDSSGSRWRVI